MSYDIHEYLDDIQDYPENYWEDDLYQLNQNEANDYIHEGDDDLYEDDDEILEDDENVCIEDGGHEFEEGLCNGCGAYDPEFFG